MTKRVRGTFTTYNDLNDLLGREWIERIWTYQEVVFASNPVVVCGDCHLAWSRFAISIMFLDRAGLDFKTRIPSLTAWTSTAFSRDIARTDSPNIFWPDAPPGEQPDNMVPETNMQRYRRFIHRVCKLFSWVRFAAGCLTGTIAGGVIGLFVLGLFQDQNVTPEVPDMLRLSASSVAMTRTSSLTRTLTQATTSSAQSLTTTDLTSACQSLCDEFNKSAGLVGTTMAECSNQCVRQYLSDRTLAKVRYPAFALFTVFTLALLLVIFTSKMEFPLIGPTRSRKTLQDHMVEGIYDRKSHNPKDKAFGIHSFLQKLTKHDISIPDYSRPLGDVHGGLSVDLIHATGSLHVLFLAALTNVVGQPSWVSDWSADIPPFWKRNWPAAKHPLFQDYENATPGSRSIYRWNAENGDVLVVQGWEICTITNLFIFQMTGDVYQEDKIATHLDNI
jgi:hypothetical protein